MCVSSSIVSFPKPQFRSFRFNVVFFCCKIYSQLSFLVLFFLCSVEVLSSVNPWGGSGDGFARTGSSGGDL